MYNASKNERLCKKLKDETKYVFFIKHKQSL